MDVDASDFRRLIEQLGELNKTLLAEKRVEKDSDAASKAASKFDTSATKIVNAIGKLNSTIESSVAGRSRTTAEEELALQKFTSEVDSATEAQGKLAAAAAEAADAANQMAKEQAQAARRAAMSAQEREQEDRKANIEKNRTIVQGAADEYKTKIEKAKQAGTHGKRFWEEMSGANGAELFKNKLSSGLENYALEHGMSADAVKRWSMGLEVSGKVAGATIDGLTKGLRSYTSSLLEGQLGATTTAKALTALATPVLDLVETLGNVATVASFFLPIARVFKVLTGAAGLAATGLAKVGKFALEFQELQARMVEQTLDSFRKLSSVGAAGAEGIDSAFESLQTLGYTAKEIDEFNRLIVESGTKLAQFGMGTTSGVKAIEEVAVALRQSGLNLELERMGIQTKEQNKIALNYMHLQARAGTLQNKTAEQLARETAKYAKELDAVIRLTGIQREEAERAMEAAQLDERIQAAELEAEISGNEELKQRIELGKRLSVIFESLGMKDLSKGIRAVAAGEGVSTPEAARFAQMQGMEALATGDLGQALKILSKTLPEQSKQFATLTRVAGAPTELFGPEYTEQVKAGRILERAQIEAAKGTGDIVSNLEKIREEERKNIGERTKAAIDLELTNRNIARDLDKAAFDLVDAGKIQLMAAKALEEGAKKFKELTGLDKRLEPAGGRFGTYGSAAAPATASAAAVAVLGAREQAESRQTQVREQRKQIEQQYGRGSDQAKAARIEERKAGLEAERARAAEYHQGKIRGQAAIMGGAPPEPKSSSMMPAGKQDAAVSKTGLDVDLNKIFTFTANSGSRQSFENLDPAFKQQVIAAAIDYNSLTGNKIQINSAHRDLSDQQRLWDETVRAGRPGIGPTGDKVAKPSPSSPHVQGLAVDIQNYADIRAVESFNKNGLFQRVPDDKVHFSAANGGIIPAAPGGRTVLAAEAGLNEAFVPLPDGRNIPVTLNVEELISKMQLKEVDIANNTTEMLENTVTKMVETARVSGISEESLERLSREFSSMNDKLAQMLDVLSSSREIQSSLLTTSMN